MKEVELARSLPKGNLQRPGPAKRREVVGIEGGLCVFGESGFPANRMVQWGGRYRKESAEARSCSDCERVNLECRLPKDVVGHR